MDDPNNPAIIAVLGVTGSGKSSFIKRVTGNEDIVIGDDLNSSFDDGERTDEDIFDCLAEWLRQSHAKGQRLSGLLYLHRIIANREKGSDLRNLKVFKSLCGSKNFDKIVLGITWWDKAEPDVALARESMLRDEPEFWGDMLKAGARMRRISHEHAGCINLLQEFAQNRPAPLLIQEEMAQGIKPSDTSAAEQMSDYQEIRAIRDAETLEMRALAETHRIQQQAIEQQAFDRRIEQRRRQREMEMQQMSQIESLEAVRKQMSQPSTGTKTSNPMYNEREKRIRDLEEALQRARRQTQLPAYSAEDNAERIRIMNRARLHYEAIVTFMNRLATITKFKQSWRYIANPTREDPSPLCAAFCDRCMKEASIRGHYLCKHCTVSHLKDTEQSAQILICNQCKEKGMSCLNRSHTMEYQSPDKSKANDGINHLLEYCPRARHISAALRCNECGNEPGPLFLHCCECNDDNFDLCLDCFASGKTCKKKRKHTLFVHSWCPPSEFRRIDQIIGRGMEARKFS